ncbi:hypothetical protein H1C71_038547, partial [Ictidomys tridecemlineatus]
GCALLLLCCPSLGAEQLVRLLTITGFLSQVCGISLRHFPFMGAVTQIAVSHQLCSPLRGLELLWDPGLRAQDHHQSLPPFTQALPPQPHTGLIGISLAKDTLKLTLKYKGQTQQA